MRLYDVDHVPFEDGVAAQRVSGEDVLLALDYPTYFHLLGMPLPDGRSAILDGLRQDGLIAPSAAGGFDVTNLGAILFARDLGAFPRLKRKAVRVIEYRGTGRTEGVGEREYAQGYAPAFQTMVDYVNGKLPTREVIGDAFRRTLADYPPLAVRELVANALLHQDFSVTGAGPMVEIFEGRIEITNPGEPLVDARRFLDRPPVLRNEALTSLMRRLDICEERGGGIDKVVAELEARQLPAPLFEVLPDATRVVLFGPKPLADMDRSERVRACYLHACLKYVARDFSDQRIAARPLRRPVEQQGDGVALHPRGGRRGHDPAVRRAGAAEDAPLRPRSGPPRQRTVVDGRRLRTGHGAA